jgi:hypothetical protein
LIYGTNGSFCSFVAGLNSTPVLIWAFVFVICLQALKVSDKRSVNQRDKKGKVSRMRRMAVSSGGRSAASLAATYSALVGYVKLSGGRVEPSKRSAVGGNLGLRDGS